ncbi:hypothetical protein [Orenia metallireducens]|uniref:hypothetical protein n=1 Tax=Orenia metallireducens TaxID=1413210 RepID=UPI0015E62B81|nr:hypothetical protein [Orenia metallireducens]
MKRMKEYLKRVGYFALVYILTNLFFHNLSFFSNGEFGVSLTVDIWTLIGIIILVIHSIFHVGIIKLVSIKLDKFIYKSTKFIIYSAFIQSCFEGFDVLFFGPWKKLSAGEVYSIVTLYFTVLVLSLYYLWKYRVELAVGMFIINLIIYKANLAALNKEDFLDRLLSNYFELGNYIHFFKGVLLLIVLMIFLAITILLRKKGVYDYRSRQEQWQEKMKQGYYARYEQ